MSETLTTRQVAAELERTPRRVRQLVEEAALPLRPDWSEGRPRLVIARSDLDEWKRDHWDANPRRWFRNEFPS